MTVPVVVVEKAEEGAGERGTQPPGRLEVMAIDRGFVLGG